jgi:O-antigen ligase
VNAAALAQSQPHAKAAGWSPRGDGVVLLQLFALAAVVLPSDAVFKPVGAAGYPASLFGVLVLGLFVASVLLGFHDPTRYSHPIQGVLCVMWLALLASYILMDHGRLTGAQISNADRVLIRYAVITGVALVAAEWLRSLHDAMRVVRVLCWAGAFCGLVAALQYWISLDLAQYLRALPGFTVNSDYSGIGARGSLNRVAGTAMSPIELGVVAGMLIPIAVCLALYERGKGAFKRWGPLTLITLGVATSVSRSAVLAVVVAFSVLVVLLPPLPRLAALAALPVALAGIFVSAHRLLGTLADLFTGASSDSSVLYRTHDYPVAEAQWRAAPWFGHGPGTWLPADPLNVFDNQYLDSIVELGLIGTLALLVFLVVPAFIALGARRRSTNPDLRLLCAALAAAAFVAPLCSLTFDSLFFPMFANVYALIIGLTGACVRFAAAERVQARKTIHPAALVPTRIQFTQPAGFRPRRADS